MRACRAIGIQLLSVIVDSCSLRLSNNFRLACRSATTARIIPCTTAFDLLLDRFGPGVRRCGPVRSRDILRIHLSRLFLRGKGAAWRLQDHVLGRLGDPVRLFLLLKRFYIRCVDRTGAFVVGGSIGARGQGHIKQSFLWHVHRELPLAML